MYSCRWALTGTIYTLARTRLALTLTIYTPYLTIANIHTYSSLPHVSSVSAVSTPIIFTPLFTLNSVCYMLYYIFIYLIY